MSDYWKKLQDPRWQRVRLKVMERDGFKCRDCEGTSETLHVHHCHYVKGGPWETPMELLLTLCRDCHENRQMAEDGAKRDVARFLAGRSVYEIESFAESMAQAEQQQWETVQAMDYGKEWSFRNRWMQHAISNPEFRPIYNAVTGEDVDWDTVLENIRLREIERAEMEKNGLPF